MSWPEGGRSLCIWITRRGIERAVAVQLKPELYANGTPGLADVAVDMAAAIKAELDP
jgi:hypothetical protein